MGDLVIGESAENGVVVTPLRRIHHPKGDVYHALKAGEPLFQEFGEAYFTTITANETKGWKQHTRMIMNLVMPVGGATFYIHCEQLGKTASIELGEANYCRLSVPAGFWVAFRGHDHPLNLVLNIASIQHDPEEAIDVSLERFPLSVKQ